MTGSADDHSEDEKKPVSDKVEETKSEKEAEKKATESDAGKALAPAASSPVNPFLAAASEKVEQVETPMQPRSFASRTLDYSAHAAIIVGLVGFAWTVSDHIVNRPAADSVAGPRVAAAVTPPKTDEVTALRQSNLRMHEEIKALRANVDSLRTAARRDTTPEQVRMLSAGLDSVKGSLGTMRAETNSAIAQLSGKVDKLQPGKVRELNDRLGRLEHQSTDMTSTGSIAKAEPKRAYVAREEEKPVPPTPPAKPAPLAKAQGSQVAKSQDAKPRDDKLEDKPETIAGMYVRDVYRGVALIEGRRGTMEVVPGMNIPGAGTVKSIEKHDGNWTVVTSKGEIAYLAPPPHNARPQQQQQAPYGYGRGYAPYYRYGY